MDDTGLGLMSFGFVSHFRDDIRITDLQSYSRQHRVVTCGCPDDSGIIVDGNRIEHVGEIAVVDANGESKEIRNPSL